MANRSNSVQRAGWEHIWTSGDIPDRYQSHAEPNKTVVDWAVNLPAGGYVLDVGCGVGRHVLYLGDLGFRMAGIDVSPSAITITQQLCAEYNIAFDGYVGDMGVLPWADETFDGALSTSTIHHQLRAGIEQSLAEIRRTLKPGGLLMVDLLYMDSTYEHLRLDVEAGEIVEVEPNTFVDERPDSPDPDGFLPHHYFDEADVRDLVHSFEVLRLWPDIREIESKQGRAVRGKWVVLARKPAS